jgi:hypothetical protein
MLKGRREVIVYLLITPLPLELRKGVGGRVKIRKRREDE